MKKKFLILAITVLLPLPVFTNIIKAETIENNKSSSQIQENNIVNEENKEATPKIKKVY
ncbi:hypothetical protein [Listeria cornellensis]|uniref:hypothetical protein n=1 Tax=Listeria cornellensis TaxID=1494961 RepID=UPI0004AC69F2|nr:hypothetical protein [Listeria cornellensis]